jgi:hypothetical protein
MLGLLEQFRTFSATACYAFSWPKSIFLEQYLRPIIKKPYIWTLKKIWQSIFNFVNNIKNMIMLLLSFLLFASYYDNVKKLNYVKESGVSLKSQSNMQLSKT